MSYTRHAMWCPKCHHTHLFGYSAIKPNATFEEVYNSVKCPQCYHHYEEKAIAQFISKAKALRGDVDPPTPGISEAMRAVQAKEDALFFEAIKVGIPNRNGDVFPQHVHRGPIGVVLNPPIYFEHVGHPQFFEISIVSGGQQFNIPVAHPEQFHTGQYVTVDNSGRLVPFTPPTSESDSEHERRRRQKHNVYLRIAETISELGTCQRLKVGCVLLSEEGKVAAVGYNGAGPGMPHCSPEHCGPGKRCLRCSHAEENAVANLACTPRTAYVTHEPCNACTRKLIQAGIRHIIYRKPYHSMAEDEQAARQEWLDFYDVELTCLED